MTFWRLVIILSILGFGYHFFQDTSQIAKIEDKIRKFAKFHKIKYERGILIREAPRQKSLNTSSFKRDGYTYFPRASIAMKGRVLSAKRYWFDREANIAPYDFVLGWKVLSDEAMIEQIEFSQGLRFYAYETENKGIKPKFISNNTANMHMIPEDEKIRTILGKVSEGDIIAFNGILVDIAAAKGWRWNTSLRRDDIGKGSNEIVFVRNIAIITKNYARIQ